MTCEKGSSKRYAPLSVRSSHIHNCRWWWLLAAAILILLFPLEDALAYHTGSAPCPLALSPTSDPAGRQVALTVKSVRLNSDMEGDDDYIPFYDNRADLYGNIKIDGTNFDLPEIEDSDYPHWPANKGIFVKDVASGVVPISIDMWENDEGLTGDDDHVDINPAAAKYSLDFIFDLCSLRVTGDVNGSTQDDLVVSGGDADDAGTLRFRVEPAGGRPATVDDLALVEVDLLQVIHQPSRLIAGKPTIAMVRIANNYGYSVSTNLRIRIVGSGGFLYANDVFPVTHWRRRASEALSVPRHPFDFSGRPERIRRPRQRHPGGSRQRTSAGRRLQAVERQQWADTNQGCHDPSGFLLPLDEGRDAAGHRQLHAGFAFPADIRAWALLHRSDLPVGFTADQRLAYPALTARERRVGLARDGSLSFWHPRRRDGALCLGL
jgi:hypothetical protein